VRHYLPSLRSKRKGGEKNQKKKKRKTKEKKKGKTTCKFGL